MLIIPAIYLTDGLCSLTVHGETGTEGKYPCDPADVVKMWRVENAKALHIEISNSEFESAKTSDAALKRMTSKVDIPIQVESDCLSLDRAHFLLDELGVYRVVVPASSSDAINILALLVDEFGPRRIVASILGRNSNSGVRDSGIQDVSDTCMHTMESEIEFLLNLKYMGIQRIVYSDQSSQKKNSQPPTNLYKHIAQKTQLAMTIVDTVSSYKHLKALQELYPRKIDSVILSGALYENIFPCQHIWRRVEKTLIEQAQFV